MSQWDGNASVVTIEVFNISVWELYIKEGFKQFNSRAYYPSGLLSCLYNVDTHFIHDFNFTKILSERDRALEHIENLEVDDVVIFDRGYFSYLILRKIIDKRAHAIFRLQGNLRNKEVLKFLNSNQPIRLLIMNLLK
jgi:hypothetical protein